MNDPTQDELVLALDTVKLDHSELSHRLNMRRVFLDFMRGRAAQQQQQAWLEPSPDIVDAMSHHDIADWLRSTGSRVGQAAYDSIEYLAAQEGLLEEAQKANERLRAELAEIKRPLSEQMERLNQRVIELTAELDSTPKLPEFETVWEKYKTGGFQYGREELSNVRFGYHIAGAILNRIQLPALPGVVL